MSGPVRTGDRDESSDARDEYYRTWQPHGQDCRCPDCMHDVSYDEL